MRSLKFSSDATVNLQLCQSAQPKCPTSGKKSVGSIKMKYFIYDTELEEVEEECPLQVFSGDIGQDKCRKGVWTGADSNISSLSIEFISLAKSDCNLSLKVVSSSRNYSNKLNEINNRANIKIKHFLQSGGEKCHLQWLSVYDTDYTLMDSGSKNASQLEISWGAQCDKAECSNGIMESVREGLSLATVDVEESIAVGFE